MDSYLGCKFSDCWISNPKFVRFLWDSVYITNYMPRSPSLESNRYSASQEIPCILWNPKVHYHVHKQPSLVPVLNQINPVHATTSHFLRIHVNILSGLPSASSPKVCLPQPCMQLSCPPYVPHQSHSWFDHLNNSWWGVHIKKLLVMESPPQPLPHLS